MSIGWLFFIIFFLSLLLTKVVISTLQKSKLFLDLKEEKKPQKLHVYSVPRGGWISILTSFGLGVVLTKSFLGIKFLISYLPLLVCGIWEDYKRTSYKIRFVFMFLSATLAVILLKSIVWTVGFGYLPSIVAVAFSIFALVGAINAFNIIDGLNGLASGLGIISALTYSVISKQLNLQELALLNLIFIASVLGFFVWNFPKGKIFLGDTGSYFIGFFIGVMSILIAGGYHSEVSPWAAMVVMFYPVWETLFSFWRRIKEGKNPFEPDKKHLHHLLYFYFGKSHFKAVSLILISQAVVDLLAVIFKSETYILIGLFIFFALLYILVYKILEIKLRFNNP